jgi:large subunit ribosomal protein L4
VRQDILKDAVVWQLACRRQGTHATKTRAFVRGGGKKPFKQKGTGNARQGSTRSPLMPGGAVLFGPQPRDYSYVLPRKVKKLALRTALSYLFSSQKLIVIDDLASTGKTGELQKRLTTFGLKKAVLVDGQEQEQFRRAARNLKGFRYYSVAGLNVYDLLKYDSLIVTKSSIEQIVKRCGVEK